MTGPATRAFADGFEFAGFWLAHALWSIEAGGRLSAFIARQTLLGHVDMAHLDAGAMEGARHEEAAEEAAITVMAEEDLRFAMVVFQTDYAPRASRARFEGLLYRLTEREPGVPGAFEARPTAFTLSVRTRRRGFLGIGKRRFAMLALETPEDPLDAQTRAALDSGVVRHRRGLHLWLKQADPLPDTDADPTIA
ncbi:MAG: hypothetical protein AAFV86_08010 [Pseudomonadota bacterium]